MRNSLGPLLRRASTGALALVTIWAPAASGASAPPAEAERVPFAQRYHALQHGGIVRAANTSISCRADSAACPAVREGQAAVNGDFDMFYVDVDRDPNTYNSSRAEVRLPEGGRATYARLYWGGNLRVGEQKPPKDNGRVLIAEPGGEYKAVLADTVVGHRVAGGADAFQASADVTKLVRESGSGLYTVAQINTAMGKSAAGAWGGWTLVVAYEKPREPLQPAGVVGRLRRAGLPYRRGDPDARSACARARRGTRGRGGVQRGSRPHRGFAHPRDRSYERHRAR